MDRTVRLAARLVTFCMLVATLPACNAGSTAPTAPQPVRLQPGDLVYQRAARGESHLTINIGIGDWQLEQVCGVGPPDESGAWPCQIPLRLYTNTEYWIHVRTATNDGFAGGDFYIRGQKVTRTTRVFESFLRRMSWTAGRFRIVDRNLRIE